MLRDSHLNIISSSSSIRLWRLIFHPQGSSRVISRAVENVVELMQVG